MIFKKAAILGATLVFTLGIVSSGADARWRTHSHYVKTICRGGVCHRWTHNVTKKCVGGYCRNYHTRYHWTWRE